MKLTNHTRFYEFYKSLPYKDHMDEETFAEFFASLFTHVKDFILLGDSVQISRKSGYLQILGEKSGPGCGNTWRKPVNWQATYELWENDKEALIQGTRVFYENIHSNLISYGVYWIKGKYFLLNKKWYKFNTSKTLKEGIESNVKGGAIYNLQNKSPIA